jgi:hypothetical protein
MGYLFSFVSVTAKAHGVIVDKTDWCIALVILLSVYSQGLSQARQT